MQQKIIRNLHYWMFYYLEKEYYNYCLQKGNKFRYILIGIRFALKAGNEELQNPWFKNTLNLLNRRFIED